jgi:hypothetical protein
MPANECLETSRFALQLFWAVISALGPVVKPMIPRAGVVIYHSSAFYLFWICSSQIICHISLVTLFSKRLGLSTLYI